MRANRFWNYENAALAILSLAFSLVFFDRMSIMFLLPYVVPELKLSNTQIGLMNSVLSLAWAVSGFLLVVRAIMGLAEGPVLPITQSVMAQESSPARRGFNLDPAVGRARRAGEAGRWQGETTQWAPCPQGGATRPAACSGALT